MDALATLIEQVKTLSLGDFLRQRQGPYLLRYLTPEELNTSGQPLADLFDEQATSRGTAVPLQDQTDEFHAYKPDPKPVTSTLARLAEPLDRFACYSIQKSDRNVFPYGTTLGRTRNNDVIVPLPVVSKFHAWIQRQPDHSFLVFDARSRFGTFVDGIQVSPAGDKGSPLRPGGTLRLGDVSLLFVEANSLYSWISIKLRQG